MGSVNLGFRFGTTNLPAVGQEVMVKGVFDVNLAGFTSATKVAVAFVVDCSGSMDGRLPPIRNALRAVHAQMGPQDLLGVWGYSSSGWEIIPLVSKKEYSNRFGDLTAGLVAQGMTYAAEGLRPAVAALGALDNSYTKVTILITDGAESGEAYGEQQAADVLVDQGIHIIPVTIDPSVPQRFFDVLLAAGVNPTQPILPSQAATTAPEIEAVPVQLFQKLRSRLGTDVRLVIEPAGFTKLTSVYEVSPNLRQVSLTPEGTAFAVEVQDDLSTDGLSLYLQASFEAPDEDAVGMQPFLNSARLEWEDLATGQPQQAVLGTIEVAFVEPGSHDTSPDPALNDLFRMVLAQQRIDDALRLAKAGDIDKSLAALSQAGSIAAAASGGHSDLQSLVANLSNQVRSGSLSAMTVGQSIAGTSLAAQSALSKLRK